MNPVQVVVTLVGVALAVAVNVYFFAPARAWRVTGAHEAGARDERLGGARPEGAGLVMPGDGGPVMPGETRAASESAPRKPGR